MIKIVFLFFAFSSSIVFQSIAQQSFTIATETQIPFQFLSDDKPIGYCVELVDAIFKKMEVPYSIQFGYKGNRAYKMITDGKADAILSISYAKKREQDLDFPENFNRDSDFQNFMWVSEYVLFYNKNRENELKSLSNYLDMKDKNIRVGVIAGFSYEPEFFAANLTIVEGKDYNDNFNKLLNNEIDVFFMDKMIGKYTLNNSDLDSKISYIPKKFIVKPYTLAFSKKSSFPNKAEIMKRFYEELELTKKNGLAKKILFKYISNYQ